MKKYLISYTLVFICGFIFAASYKNNTYQKLADEYSQKAQSAFDAGVYDKAVEYSQKAEENAALSKEYIEKMLATAGIDETMKLARERLAWAKSIHADTNFPMAFSAGEDAMKNAEASYSSEDYEGASLYAKQVLAALEGVSDVMPLPRFYIVRPWAESKDCLWSISGRPYVYNNPMLWDHLYQKNKNLMPKTGDPNLIFPGTKLEIPSITGELREGTYDPHKKYDSYNMNR